MTRLTGARNGMRGSRPPFGNSATIAGDEATPLDVDNTDCTDDGGRS